MLKTNGTGEDIDEITRKVCMAWQSNVTRRNGLGSESETAIILAF
jgi:hypothetical protein